MSAPSPDHGDHSRLDALFRPTLEPTEALTLCELARRVLELAGEIVAADQQTLILVAPGGGATEVVSSAPLPGTAATIESGSPVDAVLRGGSNFRGRLEAAAAASIPGLNVGDRPVPVLVVPITLWGKVTGVMCFARDADSPAFADEECERVANLGSQAGAALELARVLTESRTRQQALHAAHAVAQAILEGSGTDDVLRLVARWATTLSDATMAFVNTPDENEVSMLVVRATAGGGAEAAMGTTLIESEPLSAAVMTSRRPLLVDRASDDERTRTLRARVGPLGPGAFVPLWAADQVHGAILVAREPGARPFTDDELVILQAFATEAAVALQYIALRSELDRLAVLDERERIAMELHDGVVQSLFVVGLSLQSAHGAAHDRAEVERRLDAAMSSIDGAIRDLRGYIFGLQPRERDDQHLERALHDVSAVFDRAGPVAITVQVEPAAAFALESQRADVTQAAREAVSNAVRHARGDAVSLRLVEMGGEVVLEVADNGVGFDPVAAVAPGHGLANLRARAEALGATFEIDSGPGGTTVRLRVPV